MRNCTARQKWRMERRRRSLKSRSWACLRLSPIPGLGDPCAALWRDFAELPNLKSWSFPGSTLPIPKVIRTAVSWRQEAKGVPCEILLQGISRKFPCFRCNLHSPSSQISGLQVLCKLWPCCSRTRHGHTQTACKVSQMEELLAGVGTDPPRLTSSGVSGCSIGNRHSILCAITQTKGTCIPGVLANHDPHNSAALYCLCVFCRISFRFHSQFVFDMALSRVLVLALGEDKHRIYP